MAAVTRKKSEYKFYSATPSYPKRTKAFWVVDCESDPFKPGRVPKPFIWGLYGGPNREDYYEFTDAAELVAFLENRREIVYAHNGGKFDYHYLRDYINKGEPISIIAGRLAKFRIGECEFRDSMNILPVALRQFKKDDIDYAIMEPEVRDLPHNRETIRKYLRSDCVNLYELIEAHRKENGVALTQAGASMRRWLKTSKEKRPKQTAAAFNLYKPFYYGGRVQCFEQGFKRTKFKLLDINSAYPHAMRFAHPFSVKAHRLSHLPKDSELHKCLITLEGVAKGCFPYRLGDEVKGDLYFPDDERTIREYHITGYELIEAFKWDAIKVSRIKTVHYFEHSVKFEDYIMDNWNKRKEAKRLGNKAMDIIYKLLMNSLYGKFASDYAKYRDYLLSFEDDFFAGSKWLTKGFERDTPWGNGIWLLSKPIPEEKHKYYNVATAASITGFVRAMLFAASRSVSGPIYCDTDSMACVDTASLALGGDLGQWKVEGDFDSYAIAGKKTYVFHKDGAPESEETDDKGEYLHYKLASKGVRLTPAQILDAALGREVSYMPSVPTYSVKRDAPKFISRSVRITAKDIRRVPDHEQKEETA